MARAVLQTRSMTALFAREIREIRALTDESTSHAQSGSQRAHTRRVKFENRLREITTVVASGHPIKEPANVAEAKPLTTEDLNHA